MTPGAAAAAKLRELLRNQSLPSSRCGHGFVELVAPLIATGALDWQKAGAGEQLVIRNPEVVRKFYESRFPLTAIPHGMGSRIAGVGRFRNSKSLVNDTPEMISARVWRDEALRLQRAGSSTGAVLATAEHGVFSFMLTGDGKYELRGRWALLENPALFGQFEQLQPRLDAGAALYGCGRISNRVLDWLAQMSDPSFLLIHLPDYDPAGLSEFARLQARLGERIELYLPPDLEQRFARFSTSDLLAKRNSRSMLAALRRSELPGVRTVVEWIDRHNAGLEQEALLLRL